MANQNNNGNDDDAYVIEDDGSSVEDIEHEMEMAAKEAVAYPAAASSPRETAG